MGHGCSYWHSSRYHPLNDSKGPKLDGAAPPQNYPWPLALGPWPLALGPGHWPTPQARMGLNEGCLMMFMHGHPRASMFVHEDDRVGLHKGCLKMFMHVHPRASMFVHEDARVVLHKGMFEDVHACSSSCKHVCTHATLALGPGPWPWPLALALT